MTRSSPLLFATLTGRSGRAPAPVRCAHGPLGPGGLASSASPATSPVLDPVDETDRRPDLPWKVIVLDDPVNLMSYVTYVFRKLFGYSQQKAHRLMMQVHTEGKAVVASGQREKAEFDVYRLHEHGLWAILEQD